ncbi:MAG: hypothetical protein IPM29_06740 [Planctomycetes bacterium]|nr:hypothetical protein [Planctomycetota bacterium]
MKQLASTRLLHLLLMSSVLVAAAVVGLLTDGGLGGQDLRVGDPARADELGITAIGVLVLIVLVGARVRARNVERARRAEDDLDAVRAYCHGALLWAAVLEGAALLLLVVALVAGSLVPFGLAALLPVTLGLATTPGEAAFRAIREDFAAR